MPAPDPRLASPEPGTKVVRGFTTATVFELSQTDGEPIPEPVRAKCLEGEGPEGAWAGLSRLVESEGFTVGMVDPSDLGDDHSGRSTPAGADPG